ncbi:MAG TPA: glycine cleavage T C-terminal barrel domain-containing protein, partial [Hanamia sp.]|nr:glycine cleavage T C-terminal barrel domain-containing protein [Hanamia sp.]
EILQKQKAEGIKRKLVGIELMEKGIPRHGYEILNRNDEIIGHVTSGTQSPSLRKAIGMAYVQLEYAAAGTEIFIKIRDKKVPAKVVKMPFE